MIHCMVLKVTRYCFMNLYLTNRKSYRLLVCSSLLTYRCFVVIVLPTYWKSTHNLNLQQLAFNALEGHFDFKDLILHQLLMMIRTSSSTYMYLVVAGCYQGTKYCRFSLLVHLAENEQMNLYCFSILLKGNGHLLVGMHYTTYMYKV